MMGSLKRNLMLGIAAVTTMVFLASAGAVYLLARGALFAEFDATTIAKASGITAMIEMHNGKVKLDELDEGTPAEFLRANQPEYFQLWLDDGRTLAKSTSLSDHELTAGEGMASGKLITLPDGRRGRQSTRRFTVHQEEDEHEATQKTAILTVARETAELDRMLARLGWVLFIVSAVAVGSMLGLSALVIRKGLKPVNDLAERLTKIGATTLSERLSLNATPAELSPIVLRLNDLLDRLHSAFDREKSFTSDAAHELRTPLAGLESALEVCARKDREPQAYAIVVRECLDVVRGMHAMIDNLLLLARADADQIPTTPASIQLDELLEDLWRRFTKPAEARGLQIIFDIPPDLMIETDRDKLMHVLGNLLDNAVRHANANGQIRVSAQRDNGDAVIRISNTGSRVSADDAANVFERFWRGDESRTDTGLHCGLGLSVCKKMMNVLGGRICATSEAGREFTVEIILPASKLHPSFMVIA